MAKKIHLIAAARPNFMKIAPLYHELKKHAEFEPMIVHTGQHYDKNMSDTFFEDLQLPSPHYHLGVGGGSHAEQVGKVMIAYEKLCEESRPDFVIVVGDVNATMACAITAKKLLLPVAHLEAGLRSFDMTMPEEINRMVTDAIVDYFWTPSTDADENLLKIGTDKSKITLVGNIMIDSLEMMRDKIEAADTYQKMGLADNEYIAMTLHRPSNVDDADKLKELLLAIKEVATHRKIVFPIHPRTRKNIENFGYSELLHDDNIVLCEPLGYMDFMNLVFHCKYVITDSGGVQEETTYLKKPCLTLRGNTERPITVTMGSNTLINVAKLLENVSKIESGSYKSSLVPELWDGKTASRLAKLLIESFV
jgi:UDP-N-acetylglucosamine 2-epimerase (non-hydrolysing)